MTDHRACVLDGHHRKTNRFFLIGKSTNGNFKFANSEFGGPAGPGLLLLRLGGWLGVAD
ncbi:MULTISPECIES: hypothetical protein [Chromobacterium]|uniref:Uncharacterized protein n=1 Tax=Chromobacterium aquaticum TaxID=467180 RepID=A0ABV8ZL18_9NEIS|nr:MULTISPECIES: hypothetical protein [Chromobacterium]MCD5364144.1 hypothetical protein [Chromobacterium aquaticum]